MHSRAPSLLLQVCFVPGMLALGCASKGKDHPHYDRDMHVAKQLMYTCWQMYDRHATGLSPE